MLPLLDPIQAYRKGAPFELGHKLAVQVELHLRHPIGVLNRRLQHHLPTRLHDLTIGRIEPEYLRWSIVHREVNRGGLQLPLAIHGDELQRIKAL